VEVWFGAEVDGSWRRGSGRSGRSVVAFVTSESR